jgi:hypothetical protein
MASKRYPPLPEVMGSTEAAAVIGVKVQNLGSIRDLPEPDQEIAAGRVWRAEKIKDFARVYKTRQRARQRARSRSNPDRAAERAAA